LRKIDWILGVQGHAADFVDAAIQAGHPQERTAFFDNATEAGKFLSEFVTSGDLVLLKGSRGVRMEKILELISAHHRRSERTVGLQHVDAGREGRN
jgi:UDP-N-acetylmuramoyl-tripeptide--D-alanyl-D-alanine ligase